MKRLIPALMLVLAACEPSSELDGAPPPSAVPAPPSSLPPEPLLPPGELAGAAPGAAASAPSAVLGIVPPMGVQVIDNCESVIAADYNSPPKMACLLFQSEDVVKGELDAGVFVAISDAGWSLVRSQGNEHYLERPHAGTDCSEVAAISVLTDRLQAVVDHAGAGKATAGAVWQVYAIPVSTHQACGADRMKR